MMYPKVHKEKLQSSSKNTVLHSFRKTGSKRKANLAFLG